MRSFGAGRIGRAAAVPAAVLLLGALSSCGAETQTVIVGGPPRGLSTHSTATAPPPVATTAQPAEGETVVHLSAFQSPTGNIGCMLLDVLARCDIERRSWSPPPRPSSCPKVVDFGQGLEIGASGPAGFVCAGDTVREPSAAKLAYGTAAQFGPFLCLSRSTGVTCTRRSDGHGFFLSIQSYRIF
ncbi:MAG: DUF6636 domain-containing protein [Solirubrobacteraceae bacterium]